ncbi:hypothetical protein M422DRAFT_45233 [Sphaerobolus stellatus SS14]|nr:hypothetical protein M422DRAFT_45233 [Sphaerobolus stellatus SS14]
MSDIRYNTFQNIHGHTIIGSYNNTTSANENSLLKKLEELNVPDAAIAKLFDNAEGVGTTKTKLAGTFFFRRGTRDDEQRLFPTLAHQLVRRSFVKESFQDLIALPNNLGDQFEKLVLCPLRLSAQTSIYIFVIDALDECQPKDAEHIIEILDKKTIPSNIHFVLTSRKDPQLDFSSFHLFSFNMEKMSDNGIENLLEKCFDALSAKKKLINADNAWPSGEDFVQLVKHTQGVPLYVAMLIRYIATPTGKDTEHQSPAEKLQKMMKGYTGLDSLYQEVFASAQASPAVFLNVAGVLLTVYEPLTLQELAEMLNRELGKLIHTLEILRFLYALIPAMDTNLCFKRKIISSHAADPPLAADKVYIIPSVSYKQHVAEYGVEVKVHLKIA